VFTTPRIEGRLVWRLRLSSACRRSGRKPSSIEVTDSSSASAGLAELRSVDRPADPADGHFNN
jgi:hypothetical protein